MRPVARIAALIELLTEVEEGIAKGGAPADVIVGNFFRARRYAGSKDRRAISERFYAILRQREALLWAAEQLQLPPSARFMVIAHLALSAPAELELFEEEGPYAPDALNVAEQSAAEDITRLEFPAHVSANVPEWALNGFKERYGDAWEAAALALNAAAPLDLRVNTLKKGSRDQLLGTLEGFTVTPMSPLGLRSEKNVALGGIDAYKRGQVEVQDEAAQIASLLVEAEPGMQVVDLCAGAGGKALTVAGEMAGKGQIHALDVGSKRLAECRKRAQRAGAHNIQTLVVPTEGTARAEALSTYTHTCDRVYVDVPCSGTGTWRRSPDQRWRYDAGSLDTLNSLQTELLREGARMVKSNGRLVYMTCSVLPQENEGIITAFLSENEGWSLLDYREVWSTVFGGEVPQTLSSLPGALALSPETHGTDGFFTAILLPPQ